MNRGIGFIVILILLLIAGILLSGCSEVVEPVEVESEGVEEKVSKPTQDELNSALKESAEEVSFLEANGGNLEEGAKVKATGEAATVKDGVLIEFLLTTEEGEGHGVYFVKGANTTGAEVDEGQVVTVYGTFRGKNEMGMPEIAVTVIEEGERE